MRGVDNGGGYACVGDGDYVENACTSPFSCEPKTALKIQSLKKKARASLDIEH